MGFESVRTGCVSVVVRSDVRGWLEPVLRVPTSRMDAARDLSGGRGGTKVVTIAAHAVVLRPYRRGGLPARLLRDTYFGWHPRPFRELRVTEGLRARGAPVVEVYGAAVQWVGPGWYKGWIATRYIPGARTLWEWMVAGPGAAERAHVLRAVGGTIRRLHDSGGAHPDLNLNNILIHPGAAGALEAVLIDFDRARLPARPADTIAVELARLARSARKLDPGGAIVTANDLQVLQAG